MRILILNWRDVGDPKAGGAELVTMEHAKGWVVEGHNVTWVTANYGASPDEVINGVRMVRRAGFYSFHLYAPLYVLFHSHEFDVIVDQVHGVPFFSPLFTRRPVVVYIHEVAGGIWDFMFPFPVNLLGKLLEYWYLRLYKNRLFWTVAPSTVDELVSRGIPRSQCTNIPNPIVVSDIHFFKTSPKEKQPTYVFVSRVVRMKGIEEVIKAFSFIVKAQPTARLWVVGGGEANYIRELKEMVKTYDVSDRVTFFGHVSEKRKFELMARAHVLLHASVKEGWGLVVSEAAAVCTPAVVYNVNGLKDVVENGRTGIVLTHNSPQEMGEEATKLIADKSRYVRFQRNGIARAKSLKWTDAVGQSLAFLKRGVA